MKTIEKKNLMEHDYEAKNTGSILNYIVTPENKYREGYCFGNDCSSHCQGDCRSQCNGQCSGNR